MTEIAELIEWDKFARAGVAVVAVWLVCWCVLAFVDWICEPRK